MSNPLSGLKIKHWSQVFIVVGAAGCIASLGLEVKAIGQKEAFILFLGLFIFGVGQWINHPIQQYFIPGGLVTGYHRKTTFFGFILELIGGAFFAFGIYRIFST